MSNRAPRFEVYSDESGEWRWRLKSLHNRENHPKVTR